jgi:hypothetical protein
VQSQEDSQWRSALEKISIDTQAAHIGALEMQSFFHSPRYRKQSRSVAASLLWRVDDRDLFDVVFFDLVEKTTERNQQELITLARAMGDRLQERYSIRMKALGTDSPQDSSFEHFLKSPEEFYDDDKEDQKKAELQVDVEEWELDSICHGLIEVWKDPTFRAESSKRDLTGIAFYTTKGDYKGVDFRGAEVRGTAFYGECNLDGAKFDRSAQYKDNCERHPR